MHEVLRFWLRRGVDGFRADVVHLIGKDPALPDHPPELVGTNIVHDHDLPVTHELLRGIRAVLDEFPGDRAMVGEVNLRSPGLVAPYHGAGDELHLAFNFLPMLGPWDSDFWRSTISETLAALTAVGAWPTWVLSNHDNPRHRTRYGGSEQRARAAAVLLLTLPGTPFLYAGEELGLEDAVVTPDQRVDPGGRDGCRAPVPWTPDAGHGWPTQPWLFFPPDAAARSAAASARTRRRCSPSTGGCCPPAAAHRRCTRARGRRCPPRTASWPTSVARTATAGSSRSTSGTHPPTCRWPSRRRCRSPRRAGTRAQRGRGPCCRRRRSFSSRRRPDRSPDVEATAASAPLLPAGDDDQTAEHHRDGQPGRQPERAQQQ